MNDPAIWVGLLACVLGCYFSACNIALKTLSRSRLADLLEDQVSEAKLDLFLARSSRIFLMLGTFRIAMNLVVLLAALHYIDDNTTWPSLQKELIALLLAAVLVSVFSVAIALSWARYQAQGIVAWSISLLTVLLWLFSPMVTVLHLFDPIVKRISGAHDDPDHDASEEVMSVVEEHESDGTVDSDQKEMIEAVFDLSDTLADEIMTPRTDIEGIAYGLSLNEIRDTIIEAGHSRIPVYGENIDDILGILYAKDLIQLVNQADLSEFDLKPLLREALMVPQSKSVRDLLTEFKAAKVHIAIVLDEYGGTSGLITIEDILEELVGEIEDEYEQEEEKPSIHRIDDQQVEVDARVYIDDLNDELDLELPEEEDYDTVGGFVFATLGHVPSQGETFVFDDLEIMVTGAEKTKVLSVKITMPQSNGKKNHSKQASQN